MGSVLTFLVDQLLDVVGELPVGTADNSGRDVGVHCRYEASEYSWCFVSKVESEYLRVVASSIIPFGPLVRASTKTLF